MTTNQGAVVFSPELDDPHDDDHYCGTSYAARMLGTSVATVQQLVERKLIEAWKTKGGHRRISLRSLNRYLATQEAPAGSPPSSRELSASRVRLRVLVVEDEEDTRLLYESHLESWGLAMDVTLAPSAMEAIMDISALEPDVLITDVDMPNLDGLEMLRAFRGANGLARMHVLVLTGLDEDAVQARGGLPEGAMLLKKPIDFSWLQGYLMALTNAKALQGRAGSPPGPG